MWGGTEDDLLDGGNGDDYATDSSEQALMHRSAASTYESAVRLNGVVPVKNTTTNATANAYNLEIERLPDAIGNPVPAGQTVTVWVFDKPGFVNNNDVIEPTGAFQAITKIRFNQIARNVARPRGHRGVDVFVFGDGDGENTITDSR